MYQFKWIIWALLITFGMFVLSGCISRPSHYRPHAPHHLNNTIEHKTIEYV